MKNLFIILILFLPLSYFWAQEVDIIPTLKMIESGEISEAKKASSKLFEKFPNDPSVIFLDAVLTSNGNQALKKYSKVFNDYPNSKFADAALYRVFSYYYTLGSYTKAANLLEIMKNKYPDSPYIKAAERTIPEEKLIDEPVNEEVVSKPKVEEFTNTVQSPRFTIQAGAFLNRKNAEALKEKIESKGFPSSITTKEVGGSLLNVVTGGKFITESDASELLNYLHSNLGLNARIISLVK